MRVIETDKQSNRVVTQSRNVAINLIAMQSYLMRTFLTTEDAPEEPSRAVSAIRVQALSCLCASVVTERVIIAITIHTQLLFSSSTNLENHDLPCMSVDSRLVALLDSCRPRAQHPCLSTTHKVRD